MPHPRICSSWASTRLVQRPWRDRRASFSRPGVQRAAALLRLHGHRCALARGCPHNGLLGVLTALATAPSARRRSGGPAKKSAPLLAAPLARRSSRVRGVSLSAIAAKLISPAKTAIPLAITLTCFAQLLLVGTSQPQFPTLARISIPAMAVAVVVAIARSIRMPPGPNSTPGENATVGKA